MLSPHTSYRWRGERESIKCMLSPHTSYRWRGERVIETIKCMLSPHTSYRWRGERVIEPIKCMLSPHTSYRWRGERVIWRFSTAWYGTVRYGSLLGGFPLGTVPGTWYFFSTTSVEVPCEPYRYQNVTCKLCWSLIGRRKSSLLRHWTCDTRPSSSALPARFKSVQPAKDRTQLLFKQMHIFASTTK